MTHDFTDCSRDSATNVSNSAKQVDVTSAQTRVFEDVRERDVGQGRFRGNAQQRLEISDVTSEVATQGALVFTETDHENAATS